MGLDRTLTIDLSTRSGNHWFIGVINGEEATTLNVSLNFPGHGRFQMIRLDDVPDRLDAAALSVS